MIKISPERFETILKEFEAAFEISDKKPVPEFLKDINLLVVLRPLNGIPPEFNPKPRLLAPWKPQMDETEANVWSLNSIFRHNFSHSTKSENLESLTENGFDTKLSGELECGGGVYVSPTINQASLHGDGKTIVPVRINVSNPLVIENPNLIEFDKLRKKFAQVTEDFSKERKYSNDERQALFNEQMRRFFTRHGFDMIINRTYDHHIVLDPQDITLLKT